MSTNGYTNCEAGKFYGFSDDENNQFSPGDIFNLQWGAVEDGTRPLNVSLAREGGQVLEQIVGGCIPCIPVAESWRIGEI